MIQRDEEGASEPNAAGAGNPAFEFAAILLRRKGTILFVFLLVTGVVAVGASRQPVLYQAESSLIVRVGREYVYRPEVGRVESARTPSLSEMVNSEVEILSSRDLAEQVVQDLGVETLYPEVLELESDAQVATDRAVLRFMQAASMRGVLESSVIKVSFEHTDPQIAADAVNLLIEHFKDKHVEVFGEVPFTFLEEQQTKRREELAHAEETLANFKRDNGVVDLAEQRALLLGMRARLDEELRTSEMHLAELEARGVGAEPPDAVEPVGEAPLPAYLQPEMEDQLLEQLLRLQGELRSSETLPPSRTVEDASLRLLELSLEENKLLRDYAPTNRAVENVRAEIAMVKTFLEQATLRANSSAEGARQGVAREIARVTGELGALRRARDRTERQGLVVQRDAYRQRLLELDGEIENLDEQAKTLRQLERELGNAEQAISIYQERVEESRMTEELDREKRINVRVIQRAARPVEPVGLPLKLKLALGAFVGLLSGAACAVLLELFRTK